MPRGGCHERGNDHVSGGVAQHGKAEWHQRIERFALAACFGDGLGEFGELVQVQAIRGQRLQLTARGADELANAFSVAVKSSGTRGSHCNSA